MQVILNGERNKLSFWKLEVKTGPATQVKKQKEILKFSLCFINSQIIGNKRTNKKKSQKCLCEVIAAILTTKLANQNQKFQVMLSLGKTLAPSFESTKKEKTIKC